jgi:hypothetical protein
MKRWLRQKAVDLIVWAWVIAPWRAKVWAFMNDGLAEEDKEK